MAHLCLLKLTQLRAEADAAIQRAEQAEAKNKTYEQQILKLEQENKSLQHQSNHNYRSTNGMDRIKEVRIPFLAVICSPLSVEIDTAARGSRCRY